MLFRVRNTRLQTFQPTGEGPMAVRCQADEEEIHPPDVRRARPRERGGAGRLGDADSIAAGLVTDGAYLRGGGGPSS